MAGRLVALAAQVAAKQDVQAANVRSLADDLAGAERVCCRLKSAGSIRRVQEAQAALSAASAAMHGPILARGGHRIPTMLNGSVIRETRYAPDWRVNRI